MAPFGQGVATPMPRDIVFQNLKNQKKCEYFPVLNIEVIGG